MLLRVLSPVETRESRLPKTDMPGRLIMLPLVRRRVMSDSVLEAEAPSSTVPVFDFLEGNKLGRRAAGMYMGRTCRVWWARGDEEVEPLESGLVDS